VQIRTLRGFGYLLALDNSMSGQATGDAA